MLKYKFHRYILSPVSVTVGVTKHYHCSKKPVLFKVVWSGFNVWQGMGLVGFLFFLLSRRLNVLKDISGISFPLWRWFKNLLYYWVLNLGFNSTKTHQITLKFKTWVIKTSGNETTKTSIHWIPVAKYFKLLNMFWGESM